MQSQPNELIDKLYKVSDESAKTIPEDEELQEFLYGRFKILQKKEGYRFSVDPILLASFVEVAPNDRIVDLGTGSGIMPLILIDRLEEGCIVGIECQQAYVDMARRSVEINNRQDRITIRHGDVRDPGDEPAAESFDIAVCNPPFLPAGTGHVNPRDDKAIARHEVCGTLQEFIRAARRLTRQKGRAYFVFPAARLVDLMALLRESSLEPRTLRLVHANEHSPAKLALVEAVKDGKPDLKIRRPLFIYDLNGQYTDEASEILHNGRDQH